MMIDNNVTFIHHILVYVGTERRDLKLIFQFNIS